MGIENINRVGWIVIGAILGCAMGLAIAAAGQDVEGVATTDVGTFEQDVVQKEIKTGRPLVSGIKIHPADYSESDDAMVRLVTYKRLARTKDGRYGWIEKRVVTKIPYVPALRGRVAATDDLTVEKYLNELAKQYDFIDYSTGWWMIPKNAAVAGTAAGVLIIGGIWPTLLGLMSGAGFGRKYNPKYKDDRPLWKVKSTATAPNARPPVSDAAMARVDAIADAYQENLSGFGGNTASTSTGTSTAPEVRKLDARELEVAKPQPNPDADDDIEVKGEYYPVLFHHKKTPEEDEKGKGETP